MILLSLFSNPINTYIYICCGLLHKKTTFKKFMRKLNYTSKSKAKTNKLWLKTKEICRFLKLVSVLYCTYRIPTVQNRRVPGVVPWGPPGPWLWAEVPAGAEGRRQVPVPVESGRGSHRPSAAPPLRLSWSSVVQCATWARHHRETLLLVCT